MTILFLLPSTGGNHAGESLNSTEIYDIDTDTSSDGPNLPYACYGHCGAILESTDQIFFVGGFCPELNGAEFFTGIQVFDMMSKTFTILLDQLSVGRTYPVCAVLKSEDLLVVAGGKTVGWVDINSVEIMNLKTNTWANGQAMPYPGMNVWVAGEAFFNWDDQLLYQYQVINDQWIEIEDAPVDLSQMKGGIVQIDAGDGILCSFL